MRTYHGECVFSRAVEAKLPAAAHFIEADRRKRADEGESRQKREDQRRRTADNEPNPGERINETQENQV